MARVNGIIVFTCHPHDHPDFTP